MGVPHIPVRIPGTYQESDQTIKSYFPVWVSRFAIRKIIRICVPVTNDFMEAGTRKQHFISREAWFTNQELLNVSGLKSKTKLLGIKGSSFLAKPSQKSIQLVNILKSLYSWSTFSKVCMVHTRVMRVSCAAACCSVFHVLQCVLKSQLYRVGTNSLESQTPWNKSESSSLLIITLFCKRAS